MAREGGIIARVDSRGSLGAEKRRHERIPVKVSSWLSPAEQITAGNRGMLVDISLGGCRVETRLVDHGAQYRQGDPVFIRFPMGKGGIEISGNIMWIRIIGAADLVGVKFHDLNFLRSRPLRGALSNFRRALVVDTGG